MTATPDDRVSVPELKLCPFCGGAVQLVDATKILGIWRLLHKCPNLGTVACESFDRDRVIKNWNTRAAPPPPLEDGREEAVVTITIGGDRTATRIRAASGAVPLAVLHAAATAIQAELDALVGCPMHAAPLASKREFPPSSCNAWEDCKHDGVCHDPDNCGIPAFEQQAREDATPPQPASPNEAAERIAANVGGAILSPAKKEG